MAASLASVIFMYLLMIRSLSTSEDSLNADVTLVTFRRDAATATHEGDEEPVEEKP